MRFEQLYYLVEVAKYKSLTKASEQIHISQPTISEALRGLEKQLNLVLYKRHYHGIDLTPQGEKVVELAQRVLNAVHEITLFAQSTATETAQLQGTLTIYTVPTINIAILTKLIPHFRKKYINVKLRIIEMTSPAIIKKVSGGETDLGFISATKKTLDKLMQSPSAQELLFEHISTEKLCAVVSKKAPLTTKTSLSVAELLQFPLIVLDYPEGLELISSQGEPKIALSCGNLQLGMEMIINGLGISLCSETLYHKSNLYDKNLVSMIPIKRNFNYNNYLIYRRQALQAPIASEFLATFKSHFFAS